MEYTRSVPSEFTKFRHVTVIGKRGREGEVGERGGGAGEGNEGARERRRE